MTPKELAQLFIFGSVLIIGLIIFLYLKVRRSRAKMSDSKRIKFIKENYLKVEVDLAKCKILNHNFSEEVEIKNGREAAINNMAGFGDKNVKVENRYQTIIVYEAESPISKSIETFISNVIPKEKTTVEMFCEIKKTTDLYINPQNHLEYYFDTEQIFE